MKKGLLVGMASIAGAVLGGTVVGSFQGKNIEEKTEKIDKFKGYYNMLNQWLALKQEGKSLEKYFIDHGYKTVAIYGMGEMGNRLYDELKNTNIEIKYAVDKNSSSIYSEVNIVEKEEKFDDVDVMIVTATFAFEEIEEEIRDKTSCPVVSLEDVVYEV